MTATALGREQKKRPRDQKTRACFNPVLTVSAEREAFQNTGYQETIFFIFKMFSHGESTCTLHPSDCTCPLSRLSNSNKIVYFWKIENFNTAAILRRTPDPREREREKNGLIWGGKKMKSTQQIMFKFCYLNICKLTFSMQFQE